MDVCEQQHLELDEDYECSLLLADEERMADIVQPHHHDVLCGRGVTTNRHPGNESFRSLVGLNKVSRISSIYKFLIPSPLVGERYQVLDYRGILSDCRKEKFILFIEGVHIK